MNLAANPQKLLRTLKSLAGPFPAFSPADSPDDPRVQFVDWMETAIAAEIPEPHAMTLSTVDEHGTPDARVLILKNIDADGWHFAISTASPKGRQIAAHPKAALTFYWQKLGRQVRIRGTAINLGPAAGTADFLARPEGSRAAALMERQSDVLDSPSDLESALADSWKKLQERPDKVAPSWAAYALHAEQVEFWQADTNRRHTRLRYTRTHDGWSKDCLWP